MQLAFFAACVLLLAGFVLRVRLRVLRDLFIPASVVAGALGFALIQIPRMTDQSYGIAAHANAIATEYRSWPGWLIAVIFAAMLLEKSDLTLRQSAAKAASAGIYAWVIILVQIVLGLLITWAVLGPVFGVPIAFGQLLEVTWAGGFGTAAAWGGVVEPMGLLPAARDLGTFFAAMGMLYGVVSGIVLVNLAVRSGWTRSNAAVPVSVSGLEPRHAPTPAAMAKVQSQVIDPLVFQVLFVAMAFIMGWLFKQGIDQLTTLAGRNVSQLAWLSYLKNLPLFLFTLLGGLTVRELLASMGLSDLIDPGSLRRISGAAMEFLIIAALASLRVEHLITYGVPAAILLVVGAAWCVVSLVWLAPRLLPPGHWFELGIINYGMATGTTAQGMMLLRIVDKDLDSHAAEEYALAAPLSAPFIGGGVVTLALPLLYGTVHPLLIAGVLAAAAVGLYYFGRRLASRSAGNAAPRRGFDVIRTGD